MRIRNIITVFVVSLFFLGMSLWVLLGEKSEFSESERRVLASSPEVTLENVVSGNFAEEFEDYAVDHFPQRDVWRSIKAYVRTKVFMQKDNNDIYTVNQHISKLEYPMNTKMLDYVLQLFSKVKEKYLEDNKIYLAVIPDKNRYLAKENGYLSIDYDSFSKYMKERMGYAEYIEIADLLESDDYYYTDTHWRQEKIVDVAERIAETMGIGITKEFEVRELEIPFYGVYVGQSALVCEPDQLLYLSNQVLDNAIVDGAKAMYDTKKADGVDPYEIFFSGNQSIVSIKNRENNGDKRLIMFRDSFGSSIAPLFVSGYSEIVLIDLRYISSDMLEQYVDFENADVLFLYSTLLLNNSLSMR